MAGHDDALEAVGAAAAEPRRMSIAEDAAEGARASERMRNVEGAFGSAMGSAMTLPGGDAPVSAVREEMARASGAVGEAKGAILSDVERAAASTAPDGAAASDGSGAGEGSGAGDSLDGIADRFKALYAEMTTWQIAWSIAQRTQQDTNHLLRGG